MPSVRSESTVRTRRRQPPHETRTLIVDRAELLVRERPFRELSVDAIMRTTGYGRTVFYRHFSGLPAVVSAVLARVMPPLTDAVNAFAAQADEIITDERARELLLPITRQWREHGALMRALRDAAVFDADIDAVVVAAQEENLAVAVEALERRRGAGYLAGADVVEVARALIAMNQRYLLETYGAPGSTLAPEAAAATLALVWRAAINASSGAR